MSRVTILGGGNEVRACSEVLSRSGFAVQRTFELDPDDRSPLIIGEVNGAPSMAQEAVESGRPVLLAATHFLTPERLGALLAARRRGQALFVWNPRRYLPAFRLVSSLIESDPGWQPRYIRHEHLSMDMASTATVRWNALEAISLVTALSHDEPQFAMATALLSKRRGSPDVVTTKVTYKDTEAAITIGLGEGIERHETLIASPSRKVLVDGLGNPTPVRVIDDEALYEPIARWISCPPTSAAELARRQCLAFLDAAGDTALAEREATVWRRSLATLDAVERSLAANGAGMLVHSEPPQPRIRLLTDRRPVPAA